MRIGAAVAERPAGHHDVGARQRRGVEVGEGEGGVLGLCCKALARLLDELGLLVGAEVAQREEAEPLVKERLQVAGTAPDVEHGSVWREAGHFGDDLESPALALGVFPAECLGRAAAPCVERRWRW